MKVIFEGEQGLDEGGLTKELLSLIVESVLDPNFGMFEFNATTGKYWFGRQLLVDVMALVHYELIGMVLGLAVANGVILNVGFPMLLYAKLLGLGSSKLRDLGAIDPECQRNLYALLAHEGDLSDLGLTFAVSVDRMGVVESVDLIENGSNIAVDERNVKLYCELYAEYLLDVSVRPQMEALRKGFKRIVEGNKVIALLNDLELMQLIEGTMDREINLIDLRGVTQYVPPLTPDTNVIKYFWSVVSTFTQEQARQFLTFAFGSAGVPIAGLRGMRFAIQPMGTDPNALPVSHTCANLLDLPPYTSEDMLRSKLLLAMKEGVEFHVI